MECKALEIQLNGRGTIDLCEERSLPLWLREKNLSRGENWSIGLFFELNVRLVEMKSHLPKGIEEYTVGKAIEYYYDMWADKFTHKKRIKPPADDEEWNIVFQNLLVTDPEEQTILKCFIKEYNLLGKSKKKLWFDFTLKWLIKIDKKYCFMLQDLPILLKIGYFSSWM